ncbi:hypothetical protein [Actinomadura rubrisoli]|uniref:Glycosyl hydrolase-like 10 domain-containing protein n=1 Tax=Actinomadura rubrisoli TaxID=2530368 RepID=A0A4R5CCA0_9ACTN|nr:hypothetical protein [Actinomadura rubrisoli]TDD96416.1 hypothetical protein E1298_02960 [Actinomadura rubrisoli]
MGSNLISVSWGDHLEFGLGDGALSSADAVDRAVGRWQDELGGGAVLWRERRSARWYARTFQAPGVSARRPSISKELDFDEHAVIVESAHRRGMKAFVYVTVFDEGWPLDLGWGGGYETWQSHYVIRNPGHQIVDREGSAYLHGVLCFGYPEVRRYKLGVIRRLLAEYDWDGVFICTRSQSRPAPHADWFGFNEPVVEEFRARHGVDIRHQDFDLETWRRLRGEGFTQFLREVQADLRPKGQALLVGIPRASYIGPPIGNMHLDWPLWVREEIVDGLIIDQVAARCPSTWIWMWPSTEQGYGYVENEQPPLDKDLAGRWAAVAEGGRELYLARQWHDFDREENDRLSGLPGVGGLVFSSFRYDNPDVVRWDVWAM